MSKRNPKVSIKCNQCGIEFTAYPSSIKQGRKHCSYECAHLANSGDRSYRWKENLKVKEIGDTAYNTLHCWVRRNKLKPFNCERCGKKRRLHWANIDGKYQRNLDDFIALCVSCHSIHDSKKFHKGLIHNQSGWHKLRNH